MIKNVTFDVGKIIITLIVLVSPVLTHSQGLVLYENFDVSIGQTTDCVPVTAGKDGTPARNGKSLECNWDGTRSWQDPLATQEMETFASANNEKLFSGWFRVDRNIDHVMGSKLMRIGWNTPNEIIIACQFEQGDSATLLASVNNYPTFWGSPNGVCGDHQWHRIRVYTSPTLVRLWLDDVLLREWTGTFNFGSGQHGVFFMSNWSSNPGWEHDANNNVMWDDIEVFSDVGTGGTGSMREGTMTQGGTVIPILDTISPSVSISSPTNTSTVSGSVSVSADANDNVGVASVQFKLDGNDLGTLDTVSPYSVAWDTTTASNGTHQLTAVAKDAAGNTTTSSAFSVTVSNTTTFQRTIQIDLEGRTSKIISGNLSVLNTNTPKVLIKSFPFTTNSLGQATITFDIAPQVVYLKVSIAPFLTKIINSDLNINSQYIFPKLIIGDINSDNWVNAVDYSALNTNWFSTTDAAADLNKDGIVNVIDFSYINQHWGVEGDK